MPVVAINVTLFNRNVRISSINFPLRFSLEKQDLARPFKFLEAAYQLEEGINLQAMNTHETALKSNPTQRGQNKEYTSGPAEVNELITKKSRVRKVWQSANRKTFECAV